MNFPEPTPKPERRGTIPEILEAAQREARERVLAAWQRQSDRLRTLADEGRAEIERAITGEISSLASVVNARLSEERLEIITALMRALGESFLRMRRCESDWEWCDALLDAAAAISRLTAFFSIRGRALCFQGARGLPARNTAAPVEAQIDSAPSFFTVWQTAAPVEAPPDASHLSRPIANLFGDPGQRRALLTPVLLEGQTAGILYTEGAVDRGAVEAIATYAGATLETRVRTHDASIRAPAIAGPSDGLEPAAELAARRFARVTTARLLLEHGDAVQRGRESRDIYAALKGDIEAARRAYQMRFPGLVDYFHSEMVRTLAQNDPTVLGRQYPGPLS